MITFTQEQQVQAYEILRRVVFWAIEPNYSGLQFMCTRCHKQADTREDINHNVSCHIGDAVALLAAIESEVSE
jgi:hypothetical protein